MGWQPCPFCSPAFCTYFQNYATDAAHDSSRFLCFGCRQSNMKTACSCKILALEILKRKQTCLSFCNIQTVETLRSFWAFLNKNKSSEVWLTAAKTQEIPFKCQLHRSRNFENRCKKFLELPTCYNLCECERIKISFPQGECGKLYFSQNIKNREIPYFKVHMTWNFCRSYLAVWKVLNSILLLKLRSGKMEYLNFPNEM